MSFIQQVGDDKAMGKVYKMLVEVMLKNKNVFQVSVSLNIFE